MLQASSASSERSFSKAGLIVTAKRMLLKPENVDHLSLLGWQMAESGWSQQKLAQSTQEGGEGREGREVVTLDSKVWITTGDHPRCPGVETVEYRRSEGAVP